MLLTASAVLLKGNTMIESSPLFGFQPTATVAADYGKVAEGKADIADAVAQSKADTGPFDFMGVGKVAVDTTGYFADLKNAADAHTAKQKYSQWMAENQYLSGTELTSAIQGEIKTLSDTTTYSDGYREAALSILEYGMGGAFEKKENERISAMTAATASDFSRLQHNALREGASVNIEEFTKQVSAERKLPVSAVRDALMYTYYNDSASLLSAADSTDTFTAIVNDITAKEKSFAESTAFYGSQSREVKAAVTAQKSTLSAAIKAKREELISLERATIDASLENPADTTGLTKRKQALENIRKLDPSVYDSERRRVDTAINANIEKFTNRQKYSDVRQIIPEGVYSKDKQYFQQQTQAAMTKAIVEDDMAGLTDIITKQPSIVKDLSKEISKVILSATDERALGTYIDLASKLPKEVAMSLMGKDAYEVQQGISILSGFARDQDGVQLSAVRLRDVIMNAPDSVELSSDDLKASYYEYAGDLESNASLRTGAVDEYKRIYRLLHKNAAETGISPDNLASRVSDYVEEKYQKVEVEDLEYQTLNMDFPEYFSDYAADAVQALHPNISRDKIVIKGGKLKDPYTGQPVYQAYVKTVAGLQNIPNINLTNEAATLWNMIDNPPEMVAQEEEFYYSKYYRNIYTAVNYMMGAVPEEYSDIAATSIEAARGERAASFELVQQITNGLVKQNGKLVDPETMDVVEETAINIASNIVEKVQMLEATPGIPLSPSDANMLGAVPEEYMSYIQSGSPVDPQYPLVKAAVTSTIDYDFIGGLEGKGKTTGYVPLGADGKALDKSGVTISTGVDLGQWDEASLRKAGVPAELTKKLRPYFGLKGDKAVAAASKLKITDEESKTLYKAVRKEMLGRLKKSWTKSNTSVAWDKLTNKQKTVLASVHFQYGDLKGKTPTFWRYATQGDWDSVLKELRNFKDKYPTRRNKEADYLQGDN